MRGLLAQAALLLLLPGIAAAGEHVVAMREGAYRPDRLQAGAGDTLRFVNEDAVAHEVFVPTVGFAVDLGRQEPGEERVLPLGRAGRFEVECVFHQDMLMVVEVAP